MFDWFSYDDYFNNNIHVSFDRSSFDYIDRQFLPLFKIFVNIFIYLYSTSTTTSSTTTNSTAAITANPCE